ncbi:progonadoliberin-1-like [Mugil cephalus]|uniref:Progonadoliberin n=1 Tax=Mugil cephalus TaxID=48193 RepID=Q6UBI1_MUGCE|nr:progonadoliberin-1-like [Mugil cephalus]AAQ83269.1 seabream-type gonadotropin-releasing hormone preproprotein [Mugil cephalus]
MVTKTLALWLLLVGAVFPHGCCQHWSYGLSPGGKRELDSFSDTLENLEGFPHMEAPCRVMGCAEEPFAKIYRMKGLIGSMADRENGHRTYKK